MIYAKEQGKAVHFLGLVSDGGVHSSDRHLYNYVILQRNTDWRMFLSMPLPMAVIQIPKAVMDL
jgi:bisphosphoglycerate-independent phosphoglycerate mutase (AlkP superfamily)